MNIIKPTIQLPDNTVKTMPAVSKTHDADPVGYPVLTLRNKDGEVIWRNVGENLVVKKGRSALIFLLTGSGGDLSALSYCSLGTGGVSAGAPWTPISPNSNDAALISECTIIGSSPATGKKAISSTVFDNPTAPTQATLHTSFTAAEINDIVSEAGLWFSDKTTLYARHTFPSAYLKIDQGNILDVDWIIKFI